MRGLVLFLSLLVVIVSFSFIVIGISNLNNAKIHASKREILPQKFTTFTSAVCENKEEIVYCKDLVFMNCNGNILKVIDVAECNGLKLDVPKLTGSAVFDKGWKDLGG